MDLLRDSSKSGNGRLHSVSFILVKTGYLDNIIDIQLIISVIFSGTVLCKNIRESGDGQHKIIIIMCYFSSVIQLNVCQTEYCKYLLDLFTSYLTEDSRETSIRDAD